MTSSMNGAAAHSRGRAIALGIAVAAAIAIAADTSTASERLAGANVGELLTLVRSLNPELAAAALEHEAALAKVGPAGALDDPTVNFTRDQSFRETVLSVSQDFPLWGKREVRTGVAQANAQGAQDRQETMRRDLEERVKVAFAQYYQARTALRVTHDIHALLHSVAGTARSRYAQGLVNQSDAIRAELEQIRLDPESSALERDERMAKAKINALIARSANSPLAEPQSLRKVPAAATLALSELAARARDSNSEVAALRAEIAAADGERKLVDKSWYPDVTVSVGGSNLPNMSPRVVAGVGIKIPFQWEVRKAEARAASAKKAAAQSRLDAAMLRIESEIESALATLHQTEQTADLLRTALTKQSEAAYRSSLTSYELGRGDLTAVLDAAHQQLAVQLDLLRVQVEAQTAFAAIERLVGGDL